MAANVSLTNGYRVAQQLSYPGVQMKSLSVADIERNDYAGPANRSVADLAAAAINKAANRSIADRYWTIVTGSTRSLSDKSESYPVKEKAFSDSMFVSGI